MINRFTEKARNALNTALKCAKEMGHTYIGSEHILLGLVSEKDSIAQKILNAKGADYDKIYKMIIDWTGYGAPSSLSSKDMTPKVRDIIAISAEESVRNGQSYIGTEHILFALVSEDDCMALRIITAAGISSADIKKDIGAFFETVPVKSSLKEISGTDPDRQSVPGCSSLSVYGRNLNTQAAQGKLDPIIGRDSETMRVMQILSRRTKNNPCLIGEPGVGKTAVVEGLAQRIADGDVPDNLKEKIIVMLDVPSMIAGAKYRGEFEERMKNIMEEVRKNNNVILFIDEIHTIIGAGAAEGAVDAANIIKPALARSELQVIGATTIYEYRRHIEKDAALERRFQSVLVGEPDEEQTIAILRGLRKKYEEHHGLEISDEAIKASVSLSVRYITDRYLPDKAIDLIDEAASLKKISVFTATPEIIGMRERLYNIANEKEQAIMSQDFEKAANLRDEEVALQNQLDSYRKKWESERDDKKIIVTAHDICKIVTQWTGIPVDQPDNNDNAVLLNLPERMKKKIIGQDEAINIVTDAIKRGRSGLRDPMRPLGTFLFCGRTGVGKTEFALVLASELFGKHNIARIDMSEYMEKHSVSKLIGSPPGYVGYDEGGILTEFVRRKPYSVVLFDEIEKAHPDIFNLLLQIFDDGRLTDSQGRVVDFRNTVIIMTSNIGFENSESIPATGFSDNVKSKNNESKQVMKNVKSTFRPEFINRIDEIVIFNPLDKNVIFEITRSMLDSITNRALSMNIKLNFSENAVNYLADNGFDEKYGARNLKRTIVVKVENMLSNLILDHRAVPGDTVFIDCRNNVITADINK